jgi:hypothetical protein
MALNPNKAYDVYEYDTLMGTVSLVNGKLAITGPDGGDDLRDYMDMVRHIRHCKSDTETFDALPTVANGTIHIRDEGDDDGIDEPTKIH